MRRINNLLYTNQKLPHGLFDILLFSFRKRNQPSDSLDSKKLKQQGSDMEEIVKKQQTEHSLKTDYCIDISY